MNSAITNLSAEYGAAIREYLDENSAAALLRAHEAGRRALASGAGVRKLISAHQQAARDALRRHEDPGPVLVRALEAIGALVDDATAHAARRFELLAQASSALSSARDATAGLASIARLAVPALAEWCFATILEDGRSVQLEAAHAGASKLNEALRKYHLFRSSGCELLEGIAEITPEWCDGAAENSEHAALLSRLCGQCVMVAPLRMRDRVTGALTFVAARHAEPYAPADLALAEDLARRCALALENARLYREVIAERDRAENASRAKDEFLATLSHELRNPLMPVIGWARLLHHHPAIQQDPVLAEGFRAMERNALTLRRLVGDCLDLSRISEGKIQMERRPVDLIQTVLTSIEAMQPVAAEKELKIVPQLAARAILVLGDSTRLEQVIMNLLMNAVKYTGAGGEILVSCLQSETEAEIEVKDTGVGIHPAFLAQIFDPFRRASGSHLSHPSGLGLGLAIARRLVELHGGHVWAESQGVDQGSTFHVRFPIAAVASETAGRSQDAGPVPLAGHLRILLIEDSEDILFLLRIEFETVGHTVLTARDGAEGLTLAKAHRPDLIISDIKMPVLDGYELIREVRACRELKHIPAIALTGFGTKADFDRAMAAGFDACISKPSEPREISALITKLTERPAQSSKQGDGTA